MTILFITSRYPYPLEKGDKLRAYEIIKHLSQHHRIILFALNDKPISDEQYKALAPFCHDIVVEVISKVNSYINLLKNVIGYMPFSVAYFFRRSAFERIQYQIEKHAPQHIFCHLIRMSEYVAHIQHIPKTLDYMDAFGKGMERWKNTHSGLKKYAAHIEQMRLQHYERNIFSKFNHHIIISAQDRSHIDVAENESIAIVPNGVDIEFYQPIDAEKVYDIFFVGNMNYPPNIESVLYIARQILPLLIKRMPATRLNVIGDNPSSKIQQLQSTHINVTGWVSDVRPHMATGKIMLAPMLISIGLQNKILQAMAMRIPCIISSLANNAIGATHGVHVLIADTPDDYVAAIMELCNNSDKCQQLTDEAYRFVQNKYHWPAIINNLNTIICNN